MPKKRLFEKTPSVKEDKQRPLLPCQHDGCKNGALHRIRVGPKFIDVCTDHYVWASTKHLMGHFT